jgi:hypothetical protein
MNAIRESTASAVPKSQENTGDLTDVTIIRSICEIGSSERTQIMASAGTYEYQAFQRGIT